MRTTHPLRRSTVNTRLGREIGASMLEYAIQISLVAVVCIGAVKILVGTEGRMTGDLNAPHSGVVSKFGAAALGMDGITGGALGGSDGPDGGGAGADGGGGTDGGSF